MASLVISAVIVFFVLDAKRLPAGLPTSTPPVANAETSQVSSVTSSDGNWVLTMKQAKAKDMVMYRFLATDDNGNQKEIYTKTVSAGDIFSIPQNTFSPDDKYFFLKETNPAGTNYPVMTTSGVPIAKEALSLDISSLFAAKYSNYVITDVTGWGGQTLLVINTDKLSGGQGPSFWFDLTSKSFIQLSNRFN